MSRRRGVDRPVRVTLLVLGAVLIAGLVVLALVAGTEQRATAFSVGVPPSAPLVELRAGHPVCQRPIASPSPFGGVSVVEGIRPGAPPPSPLLASARPLPGFAESDLARPGPPVLARLVPEPPQGTEVTLTGAFSGRPPHSPAVELCLRLAPGTASAARPVALMGSGLSNRSGAVADAPRPVAMTLTFLAPRSRSVLALVPTILDRAAVFRASWIGAWVYWVLLGALVAAAALFAFRLSAAVAEDEAEDEV